MSNNAALPISLFEWGKKEAKTDLVYWQDRAKNGNGLIQEIANFVLKQAGEAAK